MPVAARPFWLFEQPLPLVVREQLHGTEVDYGLTLGAFATAQIRISTDGGTTWVASGVVVPASGIVDRSDDLGLTFTFASGTFATNNVYTSRGKATSFMCKRGAAVFWHNNFGGGPEEQRDVLRKNSIVAADVLAVTHVYKRMSGGTRPGIAIAKYNI